MKRLIGLMTLVLALGFWGYIDAQQVTQRDKLEELSQLFREQLQERRTQLYYDLLKSEALPQRRLNEDPDIQLMYIDERGHPVYYMVENLNAARTISTDDVWPGGSGGFSLSGSGTGLGELAIWDGGGVLTTHQEFSGRVTQMDSPGGTSYHATHVAGTMIAAGLDANAKGMSFQGTLAAYDWNNDNSEMASAAAAGMNTSNHSYGYVTGWYYSGDWYWWGDITISTTEDYGFGFYGSTAQEWDSIAYYAPYYTIVKSAGNDRNDSGPGPGGGHWVWDPDSADWVWSTDTRDQDGGTDGYDCIPWFANAKNIITVGAVEDIPGGYTSPSDVVMSSFSGWGPADDGRIKPDLVANGISLYSCTDASNSSYNSYSGTSMSSPNLSGSLNLLIRHYEATHADTTPLSSTMKGVLIQTADEAGPNTGPDYMFGWGLMNTLKAAQVIHQDSAQQGLIIEESLDDGETDEYYLYSDGSDPIRITLAWTDSPGTPPPASLNPTTPMLVNDLDLRLEHTASSTAYLPYVLDPDSPDSPASADDNVTDNAEQIYVDSPPAGEYIVTILHKGALSSAQHYSLVSSSELTVVPPPLILSTSPTQNELNIAVSTNISVTFNMDMDSETINDSSFTVIGRYTGIHRGTISYDSLSRTATLDPFNDFDDGEVVTVLLTTNIKSSESISVKRSYSWTFTTAVNGGSGTFAPDSVYPVGNASCSIFSADLDDDGDLDLATANWISDNVSILLNNGDGTFAPQSVYPVGDLPRSVFAADLDGDGDLDLISASQVDYNVLVLLNNGDGTFAPHSVYPVGEHPFSVFAADLDGDGDLDLATANWNSDSVSILMNNGDGTFAPQSVYPAGDGSVSVFAADLDGDGDLDLATANQFSNNVSVLLNNGDGTFATHSVYAVGDGPYSVFSTDLDGDGDLDLAVTNINSVNISVLLNNGDGTFAPHSVYAVGDQPWSVFSADLDGDGDMDLAATNSTYSGYVSVLLNNGDGTFAPHSVYLVGSYPRSVFAADLDGDGDLDLATANWNSGNVSVLLNCSDLDEDLICDDFDNCPSVYNPDQEDADSDGVGDSCDVCTDLDGDGYGDPGFPADTCELDNCPTIYNPNQEDTDGDAIGDSCDICTDTDGDGYGDPGFPANTCELDNCPAVYNPNQEDADGDAIGDSCDICTDTDGDGCGDPGFPANTCDLDNCPSVYNPDQADADGDNVGDSCDVCPHHPSDDCCNPIGSNLPPEVTSPEADTVVPGHPPFVYVATATDPNCDGTELDLSYEDYPSWCIIVGDTITGVAECDYVDTSFRVIVSDGDLADTLEVTVFIYSNVAPTIESPGDTLLACSGDSFTYYPSVVDPDDDVHSIMYLEYPHWCSIQNDSVVGIAPDSIFLEALTVTAQDYCNADTLSFIVQTSLSGDANADGAIDLGDVLYLISYLYKGGSAPDPLEAGDADCNGGIDLGDVLYLIGYLYKGGPAPDCCEP